MILDWNNVDSLYNVSQSGALARVCVWRVFRIAIKS